MNYVKIYKFIENYKTKCVELNSALILNFNLNKLPELQGTDYFILPLRANKLKVINHIDNFCIEDKNIRYHIHGAGMTFTCDEIMYSFEYLPRVNNKNIPIFSVSSIYDYIKIVYRHIEQYEFLEIINNFIQEKLLIKIDEHTFSFYINS
ncbi:hypothetical protein [uncultured Chryseobacterium sp.]|uniref:DUF6896 domain-containing protein n=1 Tax=uncultured Chryseobacterium sp. TaxID=259322 RepID=UPI0025E2932F|nr:hypothetical protein [uncultured Chryseobacterium sp.]